MKYKIIKKATAKASGSVQVTGSVSKNLTKISIPDTVKYDTFIYKVESIKKNAFMDYKKLTSLRIGNNVVKIGNKAFYNNKKLKNIIINSKKLTKVGKNAFENIHKYAIIQIPSSKGKKYRNLLKGKRQKKTLLVF